MIVVADTSPLRHLAVIQKLDILQQLYGDLVIPREVSNELRKPRTPEIVKLWVENLPSWLSVREIASGQQDEALRKLDPGERQAILLAQQLAADLLIVDDRAGWKEATRRKIPTTGTLGVLELADTSGYKRSHRRFSVDFGGAKEQRLSDVAASLPNHAAAAPRAFPALTPLAVGGPFGLPCFHAKT